MRGRRRQEELPYSGRPSIIQDRTVSHPDLICLHCIAQHRTALHCTALHCNALHCIALHCMALHCTALHCTACALYSTILLYSAS